MEDSLFYIKNLEETSISYVTAKHWKKSLILAGKAVKIRKSYPKDIEDSEEFLVKYLQSLNGLSAVLMEKNQTQRALEIYTNTELFLNKNKLSCFESRLALYNNAACAFKRIRSFYNAKNYLKKALDLEKHFLVPLIDRAQTRINCCTVLSELGFHSKALSYGLKATQLAQEDLIDSNLEEKPLDNKISMLAIAYHNVATQYEYLKDQKAAVEWYRKAHTFLKTNGGSQELIESLEVTLSQVAKPSRPASAKSRPSSAKNRPQSAKSLNKFEPRNRTETGEPPSKKPLQISTSTNPPSKPKTYEPSPGHFVVKLPPFPK